MGRDHRPARYAVAAIVNHHLSKKRKRHVTILTMKKFLSLLVIALLQGPLASAAEPIPLRAGPLSMIFEPDNAFLRHLRIGPQEVWHGINAPVRNQFWGTVRPQVSNIK